MGEGVLITRPRRMERPLRHKATLTPSMHIDRGDAFTVLVLSWVT